MGILCYQDPSLIRSSRRLSTFMIIHSRSASFYPAHVGLNRHYAPWYTLRMPAVKSVSRWLLYSLP